MLAAIERCLTFDDNNMKKQFLLLLLLAIAVVSVDAQTPAFPGAEGHGRYTTGGRGGKVVRVTTLEDNASDESVITGSLRWALNQNGTKTIVFDVSGTIQLKQQLKTGKDNITFAGQTAPGDGICIAGDAFVINSNNIIIRFLRFRPSDANGGEPDGLGGMDKKNIIIDHCSVSWSVDECLSVYGMENSTVQWCIASEALRVSSHGKGTHCYGGNWGGAGASYHHNLIAHSESRTPRLGPRYTTQLDERVDIRNNVFYNWAGEGCYGGEAQKMNIVNNYYKGGPATDAASAAVKYRIAKIGIRTSSYVASYPAYAPMLHVWGKFYIDGNTVEGNTEVSNDNWTKGVYAQQSNGSGVDYLWTQQTMDTIRITSPIEYGTVTTHTAAVAYDKVLDYVGCCLNRDEVDERIIDDVRNRKATYTASGNKKGYINTPADTKPSNAGSDWSPWPSLTQGTVLTDSNNDGIPDGWLETNYPGKTANQLNEEGYTYLEVYLNSLVAHIVEAQNAGAMGTDISKVERAEVKAYVSSGMLNVRSESIIEQVQLYSITGSNQLTIYPNSQMAEISLSAFPKGVYLVQVFCQDEDKPYSTKIIHTK